MLIFFAASCQITNNFYYMATLELIAFEFGFFNLPSRIITYMDNPQFKTITVPGIMVINCGGH